MQFLYLYNECYLTFSKTQLLQSSNMYGVDYSGNSETMAGLWDLETIYILFSFSFTFSD